MRNNIKRSWVVMSLGFGLFACGSPQNEPEPANDNMNPATTATSLPSFAMIDASGATVELGSFKGKKVFVNLWATWCPPCRAEMPSIKALASKVNRDSVAFVMLSLDENFEVAKDYAVKRELGLPVYYPAGALPALFNTGSIPVTFIFDEQGHLVRSNTGAADYDTDEYIDLLGK